jgi:hypothetical protein
MDSVKEHAQQAGVAPLCRALSVSRATLYRAWRIIKFNSINEAGL